jgi:hypothetical protein
MRSASGVDSWAFYGSRLTDTDMTVAGDFKYDDRTGRYVELAVPRAGETPSARCRETRPTAPSASG